MVKFGHLCFKSIQVRPTLIFFMPHSFLIDSEYIVSPKDLRVFSPFMANSLGAGILSPAMLTGPQQLNGGILLTPDPPSPPFPPYGRSLSTSFFFPHSNSPSTLYPYMRQVMQPIPLTYHQALYPHQFFPCAFQSPPHIISHKRQQWFGTIHWSRKRWAYARLPFIYSLTYTTSPIGN